MFPLESIRCSFESRFKAAKQLSPKRKSAIPAAKSFLPSKKILARNSAPAEEKFCKASSCVTILKHERAGESADFRPNVLHPGGTGWKVRAEARAVRGRKNARDRRCHQDGGHAKSRRACGVGYCRRTPQHPARPRRSP